MSNYKTVLANAFCRATAWLQNGTVPETSAIATYCLVCRAPSSDGDMPVALSLRDDDKQRFQIWPFVHEMTGLNMGRVCSSCTCYEALVAGLNRLQVAPIKHLRGHPHRRRRRRETTATNFCRTVDIINDYVVLKRNRRYRRRSQTLLSSSL